MPKVRVGRFTFLLVLVVLLPGVMGWAGSPERGAMMAYVTVDPQPDTSTAFLNSGGTAAFQLTNQSSSNETFTIECEVDGTYAESCSVNLDPPYQKFIFGSDYEFVMISWTAGDEEGDGWVRLKATDSDLYLHVSTGDAVAKVRANAGPPDVTPDNGVATDTFPVLNETVPFWLHNSGSQTAGYDISCSDTGEIICGTLPTSTLSVPGDDSASVDVPYGVSSWGNGTLVLTAARAGETSDTGTYTLTIEQPDEPGAPDVALVSVEAATIETNSDVDVVFSVENTDSGQGTYDLTCSTSGQLAGCPTLNPMPIAGYQTNQVEMTLTTTGTPGSGNVTLEAVLQNDTLSDSAGANVDVVAPQGIPSVQVLSGASEFTAGSTGNSVTFRVSGLATSSGQHGSLSYDVTCATG